MSVNRHVNLRVGKNAGVLLLSQVGIRGLALFFNSHLGRRLGVEALGRYITMLAVEGLMLAVISLGLNVYAIRELSRCTTKEETETLLGVFLPMRLTTGLLGILLLNIVIAPMFYGQQYRILTAVV
jgi:O-antigen/teichoic acid export membrane protein